MGLLGTLGKTAGLISGAKAILGAGKSFLQKYKSGGIQKPTPQPIKASFAQKAVSVAKSVGSKALPIVAGVVKKHPIVAGATAVGTAAYAVSRVLGSGSEKDPSSMPRALQIARRSVGKVSGPHRRRGRRSIRNRHRHDIRRGKGVRYVYHTHKHKRPHRYSRHRKKANRFVKGSKAAKRYMAKLRRMRR